MLVSRSRPTSGEQEGFRPSPRKEEVEALAAFEREQQQQQSGRRRSSLRRGSSGLRRDSSGKALTVTFRDLAPLPADASPRQRRGCVCCAGLEGQLLAAMHSLTASSTAPAARGVRSGQPAPGETASGAYREGGGGGGGGRMQPMGLGFQAPPFGAPFPGPQRRPSGGGGPLLAPLGGGSSSGGPSGSTGATTRRGSGGGGPGGGSRELQPQPSTELDKVGQERDECRQAWRRT